MAKVCQYEIRVLNLFNKSGWLHTAQEGGKKAYYPRGGGKTNPLGVGQHAYYLYQHLARNTHTRTRARAIHRFIDSSIHQFPSIVLVCTCIFTYIHTHNHLHIHLFGRSYTLSISQLSNNPFVYHSSIHMFTHVFTNPTIDDISTVGHNDRCI